MVELKYYDIKDIEAIDDERAKDAKHGQVVSCTRVYIKEDVDDAIGELKDKNEEIQKQTDIAWGKVNAMYDEISELKARIAQLEDDNALLRKNNDELRKENEDLKNELFTVKTDLEMATRWRKCSEELPAIGASVLISDGFVRMVGALMYDYTWNVDEVFYDVDEYKFWATLPEAPEVK